MTRFPILMLAVVSCVLTQEAKAQEKAPQKSSWDHLDVGKAKLMNGFIRIEPESPLQDSFLQTKESFTGPIEIVVVARTEHDNIRLHAFNGACVIFNWEVNRAELRVHRPDGNERQASGSIATAAVRPLDANTWYTLRWRVTKEGMEVFVNGKLVFSEKRTYNLSAKGPVMVRSWKRSIVDVKSFDVKSIQEKVEVAQKPKDEPGKKDTPKDITADFMPHKPGSIRLYDHENTFFGKTVIVRMKVEDVQGNQIRASVLKSGTKTGDTIAWNDNPPRQPPVLQDYRQSDGFIEIGIVYDLNVNQQKTWHPRLKLGAVPGTTWEWENPVTKEKQRYTVKSLQTVGNRQEAVIEENITSQKGGPWRNVYTYAYGVGLVLKQAFWTDQGIEKRGVTTRLVSKAAAETEPGKKEENPTEVAQKPKEEPGKSKDDKALLQGRWYAIEEETEGKALSKDGIATLNKILDVTGDDFRIERGAIGKRVVVEGKMTLGQTDSPKAFIFEGKYPSGQRLELHGVYDLSDSVFKLCYSVAAAGTKDTRPLEFRTFPGSKRIYVIFKRSVEKTEVAQNVTQGGIAELIADLKDEQHSARHYAAYTLSRIKPLAKETLPALLDALKKEDSSTQLTPIQMYAATAIGNIGPAAKDAVDALTDTLTNGKTYDLRIRSLFALQSIGQAGIAGMVKGLLPQDKPAEFGSITQMTAYCLTEFGSQAKDALPHLEDCLKRTTDKQTRGILAAAISKIKSANAEASPIPFKQPPPKGNDAADTKAPAPKLLRTFKSHDAGPSTQLLFSPDGKILVSLHRSPDVRGEVIIWDVPSGKELYAFHYTNRLLHLSFTPDGKTLLWASQSSNNRLEVKALDIATKKDAKDRAVEFDQPFHKDDNFVSFSPDAKYVAWWYGHNASAWEISTGKQLMNTSFILPVRVAAFSETGSRLAVQTHSGHLSEQFLVDLTANKAIPFHWRDENLGDYRRAKERIEGHSGEASFLNFLEGGNALLSISPGGKEVKLWDLKEKRLKSSFAFSFGSASPELWIRPSRTPSYLLGSSKDGMTLALGRWLIDDKERTTTGVVTIWDVAGWKERATLTANKGGIYAVAISPDDNLVATAGATFGRPSHGEIMVWELAKGFHKEVAKTPNEDGPGKDTKATNDPDSIVTAILYELRQLASSLRNVKDKESVEKTSGDVTRFVDKIRDVTNKAEMLPPLNEDQKQQLRKRHSKEVRAAALDFRDATIVFTQSMTRMIQEKSVPPQTIQELALSFKSLANVGGPQGLGVIDSWKLFVPEDTDVSWDYYPLPEGQSRIFDTEMTSAEQPGFKGILREKYTYKKGGIIEPTTVSMQGQLDGQKAIEVFDAKALADANKKMSALSVRENNGFIEVGIAGSWEPILKLPVKDGESWEWKGAEGVSKYQVKVDLKHNGRPAIQVTKSHRSGGFESITKTIYVRGVGEVEATTKLTNDGKQSGSLVKRLVDSTQPFDLGRGAKEEPGVKGVGKEAGQKESPPKTFTNSLGMKFVWIPAGTFIMGSPNVEKLRFANETQHKVTLTKGFYMGVYAVTQEEWQAVMGNNPSNFKGEKNLPVEQVSWDHCQEFIKKLREKDKKLYRLPTESEWEYACRAGTTTPFHFGETISTNQANYDGEPYGTGKRGVKRGKTTPVGSFPANAWGLHDMHGNVWQWCEDWYGDYPQKDVVDPHGAEKGDERVLRGGSWFDEPRNCRSAYRARIGPGGRHYSVSLRICFFAEEDGILAPKTDVPKKAEGGAPSKNFTNSIGMKFAWIPSGTFLMGSPEEEKESRDDEIQHKVSLTKGFYMGVYTVTQEQWQAIMGNNPSTIKGIKNLPVTNVSWSDCQEFIKKMGEKDKKQYRLPTEAEWEYACRAGTKTPFNFGENISTDQANYFGDAVYGNGKKGVDRGRTTPVGSFPANAWGLHDMHGNVFQWCQDWYGDYPQKDVIDPQGPEKGKLRVIRGGCWAFHPLFCRSASRSSLGPGIRHNLYGVRVCFFVE